MKNSLKLDTQLIIAGRDKRYTQGAVNPVIQRASSLVLDVYKRQSQVYVHNNSQVKKGDLLYELDPTPFINKVQAAQIAYEQAKLLSLIHI